MTPLMLSTAAAALLLVLINAPSTANVGEGTLFRVGDTVFHVGELAPRATGWLHAACGVVRDAVVPAFAAVGGTVSGSAIMLNDAVRKEFAPRLATLLHGSVVDPALKAGRAAVDAASAADPMTLLAAALAAQATLHTAYMALISAMLLRRR